MFAAGAHGITRHQEEGLGAAFIEMRNRVPGDGVREERGAIGQGVKAGYITLFAGFAHQADLLAVPGHFVFFNMLQGVHTGIGPMVYQQRIAQLLLLLAVLGGHHGRCVRGGEGEAVQGVPAHLEVLDLGELGHGSGGEVNHRQGVLGHLVGLFLVDLGPAGFLELRLDQAHSKFLIIRDACPVSARDYYLASFFAHHFQVQRTVPFLGIHLITHHVSGGRNVHVGNGLPAVVHTVVQGFFLGLQGEDKRQQDREKEVLSHIEFIFLLN